MYKLIFVCGSSRTGTTMLDLMLGNDPDAFSLGEAYHRFRPTHTQHFHLNCSCGQKPCPEWEHIKYVPEHLFHKAVFERKNTKYVIDSAKNLCWLIDSHKWAKNNNISTFYFLMWKSPIDHFFSYWKRNKSYSLWRKRFVSYYNRFFSLGFPFCSVNLNELQDNPSKKLKSICNSIGMNYFFGKENFWGKVHHHLFGSLSVRNQVVSKKSKIEKSNNYHPVFLEKKEQYSQRIDSDKKIQNIVEILSYSEIFSSNKISMDASLTKKLSRYPFWYYAKRIKQKIRKQFPIQSPPHHI